MEIEGTDPHWIFSINGQNSSRAEAGWNQLSDDVDNIMYGQTGIWTSTRNATATLIFQGTSITLYSTKTNSSGIMQVICDNDKQNVSLDDSVTLLGEQVWRIGNLREDTVHALEVKMLEGERINIGKVVITPPTFAVIPPTTPSPLPIAFPANNLKVASISVTTMWLTTTEWATRTITATATATSTASPSGQIPSGALAGIIVAGSTAAISIVALLAFLRFWYTKDRQKNIPKKLKAMGLYEKSDIGRGGSFSRIGDVDEGDIEAGTQPKCKGKQLFAFLPSIKRLSTLNLDLSTRASSVAHSTRTSLRNTPLAVTNTDSPPLPSVPQHARYRSSNFQSRRKQNVLSIATDSNSLQRYNDSGITRPSSSRIGWKPPKTQLSFSTSDMSDELKNGEWEDVNEDTGTDADFYAEQLSDRFGSQEGPLPEEKGDPIDRLDTPLILHSPAVASSYASFSHSNSISSRTSRPSRKGNKILRSLRSPSSKRSSTQNSHGTLLRTPTTHSSYRTLSTGDEDQSIKRTQTLSTPRAQTHPSPSSSSISHQVKSSEVLVTDLIDAVDTTPQAPSSRNYFTTSPRKMSYLQRSQRPVFGPRQRSGSVASISSLGSTESEPNKHVRSYSADETPAKLSIVEEVSFIERSSSGSPSML